MRETEPIMIQNMPKRSESACFKRAKEKAAGQKDQRLKASRISTKGGEYHPADFAKIIRSGSSRVPTITKRIAAGSGQA